MAENKNMEMLSALMGAGEQGKDALQMMERMERLKRLIGPKPAEPGVSLPKEPEEGELFSRSRQEKMISAAIPFLNREYQKEIYIMVRLMEMKRVLREGSLQARERQEESPALRQRKLLSAIQPYLAPEERNQLDTIVKMMDFRGLMEWEVLK